MTQPAGTRQPDSSQLVWRTGLIAAGIAVVANLVVYAVARGLGSPVTTQAGPIGPGLIVSTTIFPLALGTLLLWLLHGRMPAIWATLAFVGLGFAVLSAIGPAALASTAGSLVALALMHLITGTVWCVALTRARSRLRAG